MDEQYEVDPLKEGSPVAKVRGKLYTVYCSSCGCCGHVHKTFLTANECCRRHNLVSMGYRGVTSSGPWRKSTYHTAEVRVIQSRRDVEDFVVPFGPGYKVEYGQEEK